MNLVKQPDSSHMCGHACVAMLAGTTAARVAEVLRHDRPTRWKELYSTLFAFGVVCEPELVTAYCVEDLPLVAILLLSGKPRHWVVKYGDDIYDPAGVVYDVSDVPFPCTNPVECVKVIVAYQGDALVGED